LRFLIITSKTNSKLAVSRFSCPSIGNPIWIAKQSSGLGASYVTTVGETVGSLVVSLTDGGCVWTTRGGTLGSEVLFLPIFPIVSASRAFVSKVSSLERINMYPATPAPAIKKRTTRMQIFRLVNFFFFSPITVSGSAFGSKTHMRSLPLLLLPFLMTMATTVESPYSLSSVPAVAME